jgi:hypothetical protein
MEKKLKISELKHCGKLSIFGGRGRLKTTISLHKIKHNLHFAIFYT